MPPPLIRNTINYPPQITRSRYMEQQPLPLLVSSSKSTAASSPPTEVPTPPPAASDYSRPCNNEGGSEIIKAKIMSHPLYPALLRSFIDCRKVRTNSISHRNTIWVWFGIGKLWFGHMIWSRKVGLHLHFTLFPWENKIFGYFRLAHRRRLLVGSPPSPVRSRWIQVTGRNNVKTQSSISSW
jgi:hypothetical protein